MFRTVAIALFVLVLLYIGYIMVRAYKPMWFRSSPGKENFVQQHAMGPPVQTAINMPPQAIPSPAPPMHNPPPPPPATITPGGPGAPNAMATDDLPGMMPPEVAPIDPFQDSNMETPIKDSMRHPELSFGPGMDNSGIKKGVASGVMSKTTLSSESPFSPEFAQNGGQFMGTVTANDLSHDDTYATA